MRSLPVDNDLQHRVWMNWYHTSSLITKYADDRLSKIRGLSFQQYLVLVIIKKIGTNATATEIAKYLDKNTNTLSTILDRMEKKGLVKKVRDTQDRRLVWAVITEKGKEKLAVTNKTGWVAFQKLTSTFSTKELETFDKLIGKLLKTTTAELDSK